MERDMRKVSVPAKPAKKRTLFAELMSGVQAMREHRERETEPTLTDAQAAELDRRWAEHLANPGSAVRWSEVRRKLLKDG